MSARRQARAKVTSDSVNGSGGIPRCLLASLIEVWAPELAGTPRHLATMREAQSRRSAARRRWLAEQGISERDGWSVVGEGWPLSAADLIAHGKEAQVRELLARAGCTLDDLDALATEARRMVAADMTPNPTQKGGL